MHSPRTPYSVLCTLYCTVCLSFFDVGISRREGKAKLIENVYIAWHMYTHVYINSTTIYIFSRIFYIESTMWYDMRFKIWEIKTKCLMRLCRYEVGCLLWTLSGLSDCPNLFGSIAITGRSPSPFIWFACASASAASQVDRAGSIPTGCWMCIPGSDGFRSGSGISEQI